MAVDLDLEPRRLEPRRREPVRLVLGRGAVRPVRARAAADRVQLVEPLEHAHARSLLARRADAARASRQREDGRDRNAERQETPRLALAANRGGTTTPIPDSTVCWKPIAAPLRRGPASSAAAANESRSTPSKGPGERERDEEQPDRALASTAVTTSTGGDGEADAPKRADSRADDVGPAADPDPQPDRQDLRDRDHEGRAPGETSCSS